MKKLAVVTGGTKGIGLAIIRKLASQSINIVTCSRSESDLNNLGNALRSEYKSIEVFTYKADLSKRNDVDGFINFIKTTGKPVDILVNNAGIFIPGEIHNEEEGRLEMMINTNLYSAYHLTRAFVHDMKARRSGHIFNLLFYKIYSKSTS